MYISFVQCIKAGVHGLFFTERYNCYIVVFGQFLSNDSCNPLYSANTEYAID